MASRVILKLMQRSPNPTESMPCVASAMGGCFTSGRTRLIFSMGMCPSAGRMFHLGPNSPHLLDGDVPIGRLYRDGNLLLQAGDMAIAERKRLSWNGHVSVSIVMQRNGEMATDPAVDLTGLPAGDANGLDMSERVLGAVYNAVESIPRGRRKDRDMIRDAVARSIRAEMKLAWGKKPLCSVLVSMI